MKDYVDLGYKVSEWLTSAPRDSTMKNEMKQIAQREAKRAVKKEVELKIFDTTRAVAVLGTTEYFQPLCNMTQGAADNQRTGDEVRIHKIQLKIDVVNNASARSQWFRYVLARFKGASTATPYPNALTLFDVPVTDVMMEFPTHDNRALWTILHDETFTLTDTGSNRALFIDKHWTVNTRLDYAAATIYGIGQYILYMIGSDNTNKISVSSNVRVTYSNV